MTASDLQPRSGKNYTRIETGPMNEWNRHVIQRPGFEFAGKLFLKEALGFVGTEISINKMPPGAGVPFLHRHTTHEELYFFLSGSGEIEIDGEAIKVGPGSAFRLAPPAARSWRNTGSEPLYCIIVQADIRHPLEKDGEIIK